MVADEFLISNGHLSRLFKENLGITFVNYLNTIRMTKAKHLLLTTNLRIYEVGHFCGFPDLNYFTKVFKKATGMTPTYFRDNSQYYD